MVQLLLQGEHVPHVLLVRLLFQVHHAPTVLLAVMGTSTY